MFRQKHCVPVKPLRQVADFNVLLWPFVGTLPVRCGDFRTVQKIETIGAILRFLTIVEITYERVCVGTFLDSTRPATGLRNSPLCLRRFSSHYVISTTFVKFYGRICSSNSGSVLWCTTEVGRTCSVAANPSYGL